MPPVPQTYPAPHRRGQEAARQLPGVQPGGGGGPPEAQQVPVLRHLQAGQQEAPGGHQQMFRLQQAAV